MGPITCMDQSPSQAALEKTVSQLEKLALKEIPLFTYISWKILKESDSGNTSHRYPFLLGPLFHTSSPKTLLIDPQPRCSMSLLPPLPPICPLCQLFGSKSQKSRNKSRLDWGARRDKGGEGAWKHSHSLSTSDHTGLSGGRECFLRSSEVYCLLLPSSQHSGALALPNGPGKTLVKKKKKFWILTKRNPQWKSRCGEVAEMPAQWERRHWQACVWRSNQLCQAPPC